MGRSNEVYKKISEGEIDNASLINDSRIPDSYMEENSKTVSSIYLRALHGDTLSATDTTTLYNIALLSPFKGGEAVYIARVLLGIDPTDMFPDSRIAPVKDNVQFEELNNSFGLTIYPNPANEVVRLELEDAPDQGYELAVFNVTGTQVLSTIPQQISTLDVKDWPAGLYLVVRKEGRKLNEQKFIIRH